MPNPKLPTEGTHNLQKRYADTIVKLKRKQNLVRNFFHNDYMGEPKAGAVKIARRPLEVPVNDYNVKTGATLTYSTTDYIQVLVDNNKAINELIDGYEAAAVPDNLVAQRLDSGSYSIGRTQELDAINVLEQGGTIEDTTQETTAANVYSSIVATVRKIKTLGVPKDDLVIVVSDETEEKLMTDTKYSNTASVIGAELVREGVVSKIAGVPVVVSSNLDDETEYIVFGRSWAGKCEDWVIAPAINDIRDGAHIGASVLQGRMVYKDVLTDPTTCRIKRALSMGEELDSLVEAHSITSLTTNKSARTVTLVDSTPDALDNALSEFEIDAYVMSDKVFPNGTYVSAITHQVDSEAASTLTATNKHLGGLDKFYLSDLATDGVRNDLSDYEDKAITIVITFATPQAIDLNATFQVVVSDDDFETKYVLSEQAIDLDFDAQ